MSLEDAARLCGREPIFLKDDSTAKRVCHHRGAAFAEEDSLAHHANACFAMPPSWFVFRVLCTLGVSAVHFCSEVKDHYFVLPAHQTPAPPACQPESCTELSRDAQNRQSFLPITENFPSHHISPDNVDNSGIHRTFFPEKHLSSPHAKPLFDCILGTLATFALCIADTAR